MAKNLVLSSLARIALFSLLAILTVSVPSARAADNTEAFKSFVANGAYDNADFYLKNKLVDPKTLDTSQIFFDVFTGKYARNVTQNAAQIDKLYTYLNAIAPLDLNKTMACQQNSQPASCLLVDYLFTGAPRPAIAYFVDRGLDLNKTIPSLAPATVPMALRLGVVYSVTDLNYFVSKGMVLGDELYPIQDLASYRDDFLRGGQLNMPVDYLSMGDLNLLDMLVIALGTQTGAYNAQESLRARNLCEFIAYAAPSFTPSFDYLRYLLQADENFRGKNVGQMQRYGNDIFQPFPTSCVSLIRNMAASHQQLDDVISQFAGAQDIDTANWLISIKSAGK